MLDFGFYNMDCMEGMRGFPDGYFDIAVVDPPYGINLFSKDFLSRSRYALAWDYKKYAGGDLRAPEPEYFRELKRISQNQIIFGANHFMDSMAEGLGIASSPCWIVWDKENGGSSFADAELAYTSFKTATRMFRFRWAGMLQGNMKEREARIHPTQKPVALYDWIFENYTQRGQKLIDTHVGSGSSLISAHYHGLDYVGFELDPDYFRAAEERIRRDTAQLTIYDVF